MGSFDVLGNREPQTLEKGISNLCERHSEALCKNVFDLMADYAKKRHAEH